jgi:hypothetical protein
LITLLVGNGASGVTTLTIAGIDIWSSPTDCKLKL